MLQKSSPYFSDVFAWAIGQC